MNAFSRFLTRYFVPCYVFFLWIVTGAFFSSSRLFFYASYLQALSTRDSPLFFLLCPHFHARIQFDRHCPSVLLESSLLLYQQGYSLLFFDLIFNDYDRLLPFYFRCQLDPQWTAPHSFDGLSFFTALIKRKTLGQDILYAHYFSCESDYCIFFRRLQSLGLLSFSLMQYKVRPDGAYQLHSTSNHFSLFSPEQQFEHQFRDLHYLSSHLSFSALYFFISQILPLKDWNFPVFIRPTSSFSVHRISSLFNHTNISYLNHNLSQLMPSSINLSQLPALSFSQFHLSDQYFRLHFSYPNLSLHLFFIFHCFLLGQPFRHIPLSLMDLQWIDQQFEKLSKDFSFAPELLHYLEAQSFSLLFESSLSNTKSSVRRL